jgi:hypothetical protein
MIPVAGIDREGDDLLGRVVGHLLDVHAAFRRDDKGDSAGLAVHEGGQVELGLDLRAVLDVETVDLLAGRPGLRRHQGAAEHLARKGLHLVDRLGDAHPALVAGLRLRELALAAPAGVDLRLHHPDRTRQRARCRLGLAGRRDGLAQRDRDAELFQNGLALVFVDVHRSTAPSFRGGPQVRTGVGANADPRTPVIVVVRSGFRFAAPERRA